MSNKKYIHIQNCKPYVRDMSINNGIYKLKQGPKKKRGRKLLPKTLIMQEFVNMPNSDLTNILQLD